MTSGSLTLDPRTEGHDLHTGLGQSLFSQRMKLHANHNDNPELFGRREMKVEMFNSSVSWCLSSDTEPPQRPKLRQQRWCSRPKPFNIYFMKTSLKSQQVSPIYSVAGRRSLLQCRHRKLHFGSREKSVFQHTRFVLLRPKDHCRSTGTQLPCCVSGSLILVLHIPSQHFLQLSLSHRRDRSLSVLYLSPKHTHTHTHTKKTSSCYRGSNTHRKLHGG